MIGLEKNLLGQGAGITYSLELTRCPDSTQVRRNERRVTATEQSHGWVLDLFEGLKSAAHPSATTGRCEAHERRRGIEGVEGGGPDVRTYVPPAGGREGGRERIGERGVNSVKMSTPITHSLTHSPSPSPSLRECVSVQHQVRLARSLPSSPNPNRPRSPLTGILAAAAAAVPSRRLSVRLPARPTVRVHPSIERVSERASNRGVLNSEPVARGSASPSRCCLLFFRSASPS